MGCNWLVQVIYLKVHNPLLACFHSELRADEAKLSNVLSIWSVKSDYLQAIGVSKIVRVRVWVRIRGTHS